MDEVMRVAFDKLRLSGGLSLFPIPLVLSLSKDSHEVSA